MTHRHFYLFFSILIFCGYTIKASDASESDLFKNPSEFLPANKAFSVVANSQNDHSITLNWHITPGYYLYKSRFTFESAQFVLGSPSFPPGEQVNDPFIGNTEIFRKNFSVQLPILQATSQEGDLKITFQGCADAGYCYPPETITVPVLLSSAITSTPNLSQTTDNTATTSFLLYVWLALIGGILLNLMPCVFPVLSIKILGFIKHRETAEHLKQHGFAYTAGVVSSFVLIAAALIYLRTLGAAIGWGFQLQQPIFVASLVILFFMMGLNLFGAFEFSVLLPQRLQKLSQGRGLHSSFFTGLLSVVVATPCTVPFMAPAIGFALTQPALTALFIFAALGLGMAAPFLVIALHPGLLKKLPKPGAWMQRFKELMAFPMWLTALWLLWVLGNQTSTGLSISVLGVCLALAFALWLWKHHHHKTLVAGIVVITLLAAVRTEYRQPEESFSQKRLDQLQAEGRPVFVNITADWCITCLVNERIVLSGKSFEATLNQNNVTYLKGDWTNQNPEITAYLRKFNRSGVPLYVFYPKSGDSKPIILPQLLTPQIVYDTFSH